MAANQGKRALILSDSNMGNFLGLARRDPEFSLWDWTDVGFGQGSMALGNPQHSIWIESEAWDLSLVWTLPAVASQNFAQFLKGATIGHDEVLSDIDEFCRGLERAADQSRVTVVPTWLPPKGRGHGIQDWRYGVGIASLIARMNLRLAELTSCRNDVFLLDSNRWIHSGRSDGQNPKHWFLSKVLFENAVWAEALQDLAAVVRAVEGDSKKLIVLDLDNTLWGGVVGDDGWQQLRLGGHDPVGEAFVDFQQQLKALSRRGVVLAICSKNDESVALEAIRRHPEMILDESDFAGWRINWKEKAGNIRNLCEELNLGLHSAVFIDDNPAERAWVAESLPDVFVPPWPSNPMLYSQELLNLRCFDTSVVTGEDRKRTEMYVQERTRKESRNSEQDYDVWLQQCGIVVEWQLLNEGNLSRAVQLLNKTNQMNLRTRRMTKDEYRDWSNEASNQSIVFSVSDRFGGSGITGLAAYTIADSTMALADFVLSCRVFGRRVEEAMLFVLSSVAKSHNIEVINAEYLRSEKNVPCLNFFKEQSGFERGKTKFSWNMDRSYPKPEGITIRSGTN